MLSPDRLWLCPPQDFDSPSLKTKQHWNSFTTPFFRLLADVKAELQAKGKISIDAAAAEALLKTDLKCHWCKAVMRNMPTLKAHIVSCQQKPTGKDQQ